MPTVTERLQQLGGALPPLALLVLLVFLNATALPVGDTLKVQIPLLFTAIFYWSIYRPGLVPLWLVFLSGVSLDFLTAIPLGLSAFTFMAAALIIRDQRVILIGQPFVTLWFFFSVFCLGTGLLKWFLFGLLHMHWSVIIVVWPDIVAGILLYPLVCFILHFAASFMRVRFGKGRG